MTVILGTSFLFALADQSDRNHDRVLAVAHSINEPLLLPSVVLPEICYLIASRLGHQAMCQFLTNKILEQVKAMPTAVNIKYTGLISAVLTESSPKT
ncbi:hypothetical protein [Nostoc sp. LPT]|uniref:hypothetical protein n=1 Tax=Nostoc sp. LPT TaxID=2815387 RepID=UPI0025D5CCAF|nr:hypothetical protein [Nostoc sp. LPT]